MVQRRNQSETKKKLETIENRNITYHHLQNAAKEILTRNFMAINTYIKKYREKDNFLPLGTIGKTTNYTQFSRRKEIFKRSEQK